MKSIALVIQVLIATTRLNALECNLREYAPGKRVCVCNDTYCDTISPVHRAGEKQFIVFTSNKAGLRFQKTVSNRTKTGKNPHVFIDRNKTYQSIHGFGGAFTDATGINVMSLPQNARTYLMQSYFSANGIEYNLCRVPIGGTDFSTHAYSYDDGKRDLNLTNFKLAPEDFKYKIPLIKQAANLTNNNLWLFASVWTAPKWMKTNGEFDGFGFIIRSLFQVWADYFVKFLDAYKAHDVAFWGITTQNEPSLVLDPFTRINSVGWMPWKLGTWIAEYLGPTIRKSEYSKLKLMVLDDQRFFLPWLIDLIFENTQAKEYIDGIAVHWYYDKFFPSSLLTDVHRKHPDKFILATEACEGSQLFGSSVDLGSWENAENYANDIIDDLNHWVTGWLDWNMALDLTGGPTYMNNNVNSPILVNASAGEFYKQPMYYAMGQFSKFITRGSVRVLVKLSDVDELKVTAFYRPDNATVVVILNKSGDASTVLLADESGEEMQVAVTPRSVNSVLYW